MSLTHDATWHEERRKGIGASEVAAICGLSGHASPIDIWEIKTGLSQPVEGGALTEWGQRLEPVVAEAAAERLGSLRRRTRAVRYPEWPVLFAHLDRYRVSSGEPVEIKTSMSTRGWGDDGSADVPPHVALQLQAQLLCTGASRGYVAALLGYRELRLFEIGRDDELLTETILPLLHDFWALVETRTPPAPDGSESYGAFLRRMHPRDERPERPATPEESVVVRHLLRARGAVAEAVAAEKLLEQRVQELIADDGGLIGPGWRISYRAAKETDWLAVAMACEPPADLVGMHTKTDWRSVAKTLRPRPALIDAHSTQTGSRRLLVNEEES